MKYLVLIVLLFPLHAKAQFPDLLSYREQADKFIAQHNYEKAIPLLSDWTRILPRDIQGKVLLAKCYVLTNQIPLAKKTLDEAIETGLFIESYLLDSTFFSAKLSNQDSMYMSNLLQKIEASRKSRDFPLRFLEQERMGRYRLLLPEQYANDKTYKLILLLHGNGLDPVFMLSWARSLQLNDCIIVAPEAPYLKIRESFNSYQTKFTARAEDQRFPDSMSRDIIEMSAEWYHKVMLDAKAHLPVSQEPAIVMGFSQGGFFSSVLLSTFPQYYSTAISICGSMFKEGNVNTKTDSIKTYNRDILLLHGTDDAIVPFAHAQQFDELLTNAGVKHTFIPFKGDHWPIKEVEREIIDWINNH